MTHLLRTLVLAVACLTLAPAADAQPFHSAIGARLGSPLALSYKQHLDYANAVEIYGGFRGNRNFSWFSISGAYQRHYDLGLDAELSPLRWYWGLGGTAYFFSYRDRIFRPGIGRSEYSTTAFGLNGYLGLDYTFGNTPLNLSVDWVPTFFLGGSYLDGFRGNQGSVGIRYVLGQ